MRALRPVAALLLLGCGGGPPGDIPAVDAGPRWERLELPLAGGRVMVADDDMITLSFPNGPPAELASSFRRALLSKGYTVASDTSSGDLVSVSFSSPAGSEAAETVVLGITASGGTTTVSLSRFDESDP